MKAKAEKQPKLRKAGVHVPDGRLEFDAFLVEAAGRRALNGQSFGPGLSAPKPARVWSDPKLPHISEAPKGARVTQSSRGVASLVSERGCYLGLFSTEEKSRSPSPLQAGKSLSTS